jgi:hypothetical protein
MRFGVCSRLIRHHGHHAEEFKAEHGPIVIVGQNRRSNLFRQVIKGRLVEHDILPEYPKNGVPDNGPPIHDPGIVERHHASYPPFRLFGPPFSSSFQADIETTNLPGSAAFR